MVSNETRKFVRRAKFLCEYCHSPEYLSPDRFTIDHILPQSLGVRMSLKTWHDSCHRCNERHDNFITSIDPQMQVETSLFNPRKQQ